MANAIHCDVHGQAHLADVLVSQLANGETMAACSAGYLELCRAFVAASDQAEADQVAAEAADRLAAVTPPDVQADPEPQAETGQDGPGEAQDGPGRAEGDPGAPEATQADDAAPGPFPPAVRLLGELIREP